MEKNKDKTYDEIHKLLSVLKYIIRKVNKSHVVKPKFKQLANLLRERQLLNATDEEIAELFDGIDTDALIQNTHDRSKRQWLDGCSLPSFNATRWNAMFPGILALQSNFQN